MSEVVIKELPENWEIVSLNNVISLKKGKKPKDLGEHSVDRNISYIDIKAFETGEIRKYCTDEKIVLCKEDDVLVVWDGSRSGLVGIGAKGAVGSTIAKVDPRGMYSKYLYYFLKSNYMYLNTNTRGVGIPHVDPGVFNNLQFPVAPLEQQKRIVSKIEELFSHIDAGIEALKKAKQLLKQYRQSVLKAVVTGELTKEWREANKDKLEPASQLLERILKERREKWEEQQLEKFKAKGKMPKDDKWKEKYKEPLAFSYEGDLPELPDSWVWVSPEQIASADNYALAIGPFGSNLKVSDYKEEGVPLVFVRNIRRHYYGEENTKYVTQSKAVELKAHSISSGDVLITKMGEPPGDASIYPSSAPDAIITADCIKWRFSTLIDCPELYVYIINSPLIKSQVLKRTKGVAQKKISLGTFKSMAFPMPPLVEQKEILRQIEQKFSAFDRLFRELDLQYIKAENNKQSILASAFLGHKEFVV